MIYLLLNNIFTGEFYQRPKEDLRPGEKSKPIRHEDNLHLEGQFYDKKVEEWRRGERADIIVHEDEIHINKGRFEGISISKSDYLKGKGERFDMIRHEDGFIMEGEFSSHTTSDDSYQNIAGERRGVRRPVDNLRPEGKIRLNIRVLSSTYKRIARNLISN